MIRNPAYSGAFYTADSDELKKQVNGYINEAENLNLKNVKAIISPHAGYVYSGTVAGWSYRQIRGNEYDTAIVLALSHRYSLPTGNFATVIPSGEYITPLGNVEIDEEISGEIYDNSGITFEPDAHKMEHSLEVQVPFLQCSLDNFKIVPVLVTANSFEQMKKFASILSGILKKSEKKCIIVISTDLSHFHNYDEANKIDSIFSKILNNYDPNELYNYAAEGKVEACGIAPVISGMIACQDLGCEKIEIIKYLNSGDTAGDRKSVVGYISAAFYGEK